MRTKAVCFLLFILIIGTTVVFSEEQKIPYVDIKEAQNQIEKLQAANEELSAQSEELREQNTELESTIEDNQTQINEIDLILEKVKQKGADLYSIYNDIVDKEQKQRAQEAIQRNRDLRNEMERKQDTLKKNLDSARKQMEENKTQIDINNRKTARNIDTINLLNASIEKTRTQTQVLNSYIDTVNQINDEAAKFLGTTDQ
jgi:chromosome segregation ATPase